MAQDLGISEGVAGQSVTTTAFVAMFASPVYHLDHPLVPIVATRGDSVFPSC